MVIDFFKDSLNDSKVQGKSWLVKMKIGDYLEMIDLTSNPFQRSLLSLSFYKKLINDLLEDAVIPPISVVYPVKDFNPNIEFDITKKFIILDGLQRTNCLLECLRKINKAEQDFSGTIVFKTEDEFKQKEIYVEIWEELNLKNILYKMVVLNTGQKKMDYSHQLDILNTKMYEKLKEEDINVISKLDKESQRSKEWNFNLSTVTEGLVSFVNRFPIPGKKNAAEFLFERLAVDSSEIPEEIKLLNNDDTYNYLLWVLKDLYAKLEEKYGNNNPIRRYEAFLVSLLASMGYAYNKDKKNLDDKLLILIGLFKTQDDPINLKIFETYYGKFKTGIGDKRRKLIFETFKDFFISKPFENQLEWENTYERFFGS